MKTKVQEFALKRNSSCPYLRSAQPAIGIFRHQPSNNTRVYSSTGDETMKTAFVLILLFLCLSQALTSPSTCAVNYLVPPVDLKSSCIAFSKHRVVTLEEQVAALKNEVNELRVNASSLCVNNAPATLTTSYRDCQDVAALKVGPSGTYRLTPVKETQNVLTGSQGEPGGTKFYYIVATAHTPMQTRCEIDGDEGWTVIMKRSRMDVSFNRTWQEYKAGFGNVQGDFWLGLENIRRITAQPTLSYSLWIEIIDDKGVPLIYPYQKFQLQDDSTLYKLILGDYYGRLTDPFMISNQSTFRCWTSPSRRTYYSSHISLCSDTGHAGYGCWWFKDYSGRLCGYNNLHALNPFWGTITSNIKSVKMKIRRL